MSLLKSMCRAAWWAAVGASALSSLVFGLDTSKLKPTGYVNDFAHVLTPQGKQRLEIYCANLERVTGAQMAIVLIDTLDGDPIDDVANTLYRQWGIGKKGKDEGVLLLFAVKDHKDRGEVGYGLEPVIPDGYVGGVMRGIRPILRSGNYAGAILAAADELGQRIAQSKGVALSPERPIGTARRESRGRSIPFSLIIFGAFILAGIIGRLLGGGRGGGGGTGLLAGMLLGNMMGRGSSGWGGGGFGGSSGGSSGGSWGGFGGGDSGGGGASSDW